MTQQQLEELEDLLAGFIEASKTFKAASEIVQRDSLALQTKGTKLIAEYNKCADFFDKTLKKTNDEFEKRLTRLEEFEAHKGSFRANMYELGISILCGASGAALVLAVISFSKRVF